MKEEFKFEIHEYTFIRTHACGPFSRKLKYSFHETNSAKKTIKRLAKSEPNYPKVFLVLNGVENEEEAYVFEKRKMMRVFSRDAIRAVEIIACLPFYQYGNDSLIAQLNESLYMRFFDKKDSEELYPF